MARGLPGDLYRRLQSTLLSCAVFESDRGLRAVFLDTRLNPWRDQLPQATSRTERALVAVDFLYTRFSASDENALVLLLQVLRDLTDAGDALYRQLDDLATEVTASVVQPATNNQPPVVPDQQHLTVRQPFEPELILIPAGEFLMGSDPKKDKDAQKREQPQHKLYLPDYYIAKTLVTNAQYAIFVQTTGWQAPQYWQDGKIPLGKDAHPVVCISWNDAMVYCQWLTEMTGKPYIFPSEAEWEKATRGTDGRIYPWGNTFDKNKCNVDVFGIKDTTPVDRYPQGASPYGVFDMAGNVWEWTRSQFKSYPYDPADGREDVQWRAARVVRGGAFNGPVKFARCAYRTDWFPNSDNGFAGFRVVVGVGGGPIDSGL